MLLQWEIRDREKEREYEYNQYENNLFLLGIAFIYIIKVALSVCLFVCLYPSSTHSFSPIGMKLGMDTPWDPAGDMG